MKKVFLTVGPRGAGKSTFCEQVIQHNPEISLVSRDKILMELFGETSLNPYGGGHYHALDKMWEKVVDSLFTADQVILDTWNGFAREREQITSKLRSFEVDWIGVWYFVTPRETCVDWYISREEIEEDKFLDMRMNSCRRDYMLYHSQLVEIEQGFDEIYKINPIQNVLSLDMFYSTIGLNTLVLADSNT